MSIRVVYDTMVFFQAAARPDRIHTTFRAIHDGRVTLCLDAELLAEIEDVLNRESVRAKFSTLHPVAVKGFIADVAVRGTKFNPVPNLFTWPRHPDDDHLFNLAIHAKAKYLVTWETRIRKLATNKVPEADLLHRLAPDLEIITPKMPAEMLNA